MLVEPFLLGEEGNAVTKRVFLVRLAYLSVFRSPFRCFETRNSIILRALRYPSEVFILQKSA